MSSPVKIDVSQKITPMIYAYTTPNDLTHKGWTKIGYTATQTVENRIKQQTHTVDAKVDLLWQGNAMYQDGTYQLFTDHDFHEYLVNKKHVVRKPKTEWFHIDGQSSHRYFYNFAERDYSKLKEKNNFNSTYELRAEQKLAVDKTIQYFTNHTENNEFLWNAKPRFGKTLTTYELIRKLHLKNVLVVTNRPSVANSWLDDFDKFIGWQTNYYFVSDSDALKGKDKLNRKEYLNVASSNKRVGQIAFESLQGLKGSIYFGGDYDKLKWIADTNWDLLVIDEAHEGVDTYKTDLAFGKINRKYTLHLSGTPFKALANAKFSKEQIYNWSYEDEQNAKQNWDENEQGKSNPYENMPRLNMFTYQMSSIIKSRAQKGIQISDDDVVDPAFDLNEFFKTNKNGKFVYENNVDKFLNALTKQEKFPFSTPELRRELSHTFWLLNRVDSAKALKKKLEAHPVFGSYKIILAAGNDDDDSNNMKSFDRVQSAIKKYEKTITLSVGQLTTGVTVKPWSAVMMLSNMKSPAEYMQAAFRAQNPYTFRNPNGQIYQKKNSYVFDFDPARTLTIFDEFANDLSTDTVNGSGTEKEHKNKIRRLLNFFPVIGEDDNGKMVELNPQSILSIPRKLKSREVINRGFMSNFLFQNISSIFGAPTEVRNILNHLTPAKEAVPKKHLTLDDADDVFVDGNGDVEIPNERIIGKATEIFGPKVYDYSHDEIGKRDVSSDEQTDHTVQKLSNDIDDNLTGHVMDKIKKHYKLTNVETNRIHKRIKKDTDIKLNRLSENFKTKHKIINNDAQKKQAKAQSQEELDDITKDLRNKTNQLFEDFHNKIEDEVDSITHDIPMDVVKRVEEQSEKSKKNGIEEDVRSHLRGFSRTIPSFIMAYGDKSLTLQNFDEYTEDDVFEEVTGITEDQFRFLRDGGDYRDDSTGKIKHFNGKLFDETVFNDSIRGFLELKNKLSDYFNDNREEDIFDYIPAQKTNQIFTPKPVVKHMVDDLEKNNPGIFDDPNKTFADLYMKSGLYITEIVKRLFRSKKMKEKYPNDSDRIKHIMEKQVYGFAPTRIIYLIATNYIFGFDIQNKNVILKNNFKQVDAAKYAEDGTLAEKVTEEFGSKNQ